MVESADSVRSSVHPVEVIDHEDPPSPLAHLCPHVARAELPTVWPNQPAVGVHSDFVRSPSALIEVLDAARAEVEAVPRKVTHASVPSFCIGSIDVFEEHWRVVEDMINPFPLLRPEPPHVWVVLDGMPDVYHEIPRVVLAA